MKKTLCASLLAVVAACGCYPAESFAVPSPALMASGAIAARKHARMIGATGIEVWLLAAPFRQAEGAVGRVFG